MRLRPPISTRTDSFPTRRASDLIPLTRAIVSALIVECGGERFAIPQISVVELVRAGCHSEHVIERINGTPVLRLRNRLLPLVSPRALLHLEEKIGRASCRDSE